MKNVQVDGNMVGIVYDDEFKVKQSDPNRVRNVAADQVTPMGTNTYELGATVMAYFNGSSAGFIDASKHKGWHPAQIVNVVTQSKRQEFPGLTVYDVEYKADSVIEKSVFGEYLKTFRE